MKKGYKLNDTVNDSAAIGKIADSTVKKLKVKKGWAKGTKPTKPSGKPKELKKEK